MRNRIITGRAKLETEAHQRHQDIETQYQKDMLELKRRHDEAIRELTDDIKERMQEFEDKVSSYVTFVVDGHLRRQHPDIDAQRIHIKLHYANRMDARTRAMLPEIGLALAEFGIDFSIAHLREITAG